MAAPLLTSIENLRARRDALAAKHADLLREMAGLRASDAFSLAQADETVRAAYVTTNRTALNAERERLRLQLEELQKDAETVI